MAYTSLHLAAQAASALNNGFNSTATVGTSFAGTVGPGTPMSPWEYSNYQREQMRAAQQYSPSQQYAPSQHTHNYQIGGMGMGIGYTYKGGYQSAYDALMESNEKVVQKVLTFKEELRSEINKWLSK